MTLGEKLRGLLAVEDITQKQLAIDTHISASAIGNYFQDKRMPGYATLIRLADYFNASLDYLLDRRTEQTVSYSTDEIELRNIYLRLTSDQQEIFLKLGKLFITQNLRKEKEKTLDSKVANQQPPFDRKK